MKNSRTWMTMALACLGLCALSACSAGSSFVRPGYDFHQAGKVAVIVTANVGNPAQQQEIADLFAMHVLAKGFDVIDRANIADLTKEAQFQNESGITSPEGRAKLAVHNVASVIVVNVMTQYATAAPQYAWVRGYWVWSNGGWVWVRGHWALSQPSPNLLGEDISMTAKMVEVATGSVLWSGEGTGTLRSWFAPVGGELLGAGVGAVAGGLIGRGTTGAIVGGIAGALGGGVAGAALQPNTAQLMRSVIEKTCRGLPRIAAK